MSADPIFARCTQAFPERPVIDPAETPWTREQLESRIDHWMKQRTALKGHLGPWELAEP